MTTIMQKRRASTLPLTTNDISISSSSSSEITTQQQRSTTTTTITTTNPKPSLSNQSFHKRNNNNNNNKLRKKSLRSKSLSSISSSSISSDWWLLWFVCFVVLLLIIIILGFILFFSNTGTKRINNTINNIDENELLPLSKFKDLEYALRNSQLIALYFASSWCIDSQPITNLIHSSFHPQSLLRPHDGRFDPNNNPNSNSNPSRRRQPLSIVYISSDYTEKQMMDYTHDLWIDIPWRSNDRMNLKKHFRTCAKMELIDLHFDRRHDIPTIIIIDSITHGVITTNGVNDLKDYGVNTLQHWLDMQSFIRTLETKYI